jgi:putative ABC transport system permease protein
MVFSEVVRLAVDSFRASKVRFLLTMLGMIIGAASIILVATLGLTGKQYALDQLNSLGPNKVEIQYAGGNTVGPDNTSTPDVLTRDDMDVVRDQVPGIVAVSPMLEDHFSVSMGNGVVKDTMVLGVSPQYRIIRNLIVLSGRFFDEQDTSSHTKVTVLVEPLAIALYGSPAAAVGKTISLRGIPFVVIGVFKESIDTYGTSEISEQTMLIPYPVARYFTGTDNLKEIFFSMRSADMVGPGKNRILEIIRSRHRPTSVYQAQTLTDILSTMNRIANMLTIVLVLASFVTLIVSGVGIMNSMLANVQARIREIGIRKALGATTREIRMQFLTEAVFLSLCGGSIGTLVGMAIPLGVRLFTPFQIPLSPWSPAIALGTSVLVGVIFGTIPANRAAMLDPVETLKYE